MVLEIVSKLITRLFEFYGKKYHMSYFFFVLIFLFLSQFIKGHILFSDLFFDQNCKKWKNKNKNEEIINVCTWILFPS